MNHRKSTDETGKRAWLRTAALVALVYPIVGVVFSLPPSSHTTAVAWRLAAWLVAALTFAIHLVYEHWRLGNSPIRGAFHASAAVALGAVLLATWIIARGYWSGLAQQRPLAPLALVIFPVAAGVPAFLAGLGVLTVLRWRQRSEAK
ncbi:MAG TPA: hypothetical protein VFZ22_00935 [Pyrinomonadaceae bacterium]|nr:hypothetical protein [Pyrinomonadaceae bacterium]